MQRRGPLEADTDGSCWPFTEGQPASAFQDRPEPNGDLPEGEPPVAPAGLARPAHPLLGALLRRPREPSLVVFGVGIVAATIVVALVLAKLNLV